MLRGPQKYFLAAGALAAGWEWFEAKQSSDVYERLGHQFGAIRIVAETLFSVNPQGAILVAATNLAQYALEQAIPDDIKEVAGRVFRTGVLGRVSQANAQEAIEEVSPAIREFARANQAGMLEPHYAKTSSILPFTAMVALLFALGIRARKMRR